MAGFENVRPKCAVLGTGSIGRRHLAVLREVGAEVIAVPVRSQRREELEAQGLATAASLAEAQAWGAAGAVIATDTGRHVSDALQAVSLGMPTLCEKPLAPAAAPARVLRRAVEEFSVPVYVACCLRFDEGLWRVRGELPAIAPLHSVRIECRSYLPEWRPARDYRDSYAARAVEGGVLRDLIHEVDYALWLFGQPTRVRGELANLGRLGIAADEWASCGWRAPGGVAVSVELDYLSRRRTRSLRAAGAGGEVYYDLLARRIEVWRGGQEAHALSDLPPLGDIYRAQARAFLSVLAGSGAGRLATLEEGIQALNVCDAWRASAASGRTEEVEG